jgi:hypothetical protein
MTRDEREGIFPHLRHTALEKYFFVEWMGEKNSHKILKLMSQRKLHNYSSYIRTWYTHKCAVVVAAEHARALEGVNFSLAGALKISPGYVRTPSCVNSVSMEEFIFEPQKQTWLMHVDGSQARCMRAFKIRLGSSWDGNKARRVWVSINKPEWIITPSWLWRMRMWQRGCMSRVSVVMC